ncbi:hypothetical protein TNCV_907061 [Trichonephila clavipes]|nr:hypothetical protein TNCV_907061 [Trichonephila clavipes]
MRQATQYSLLRASAQNKSSNAGLVTVQPKSGTSGFLFIPKDQNNPDRTSTWDVRSCTDRPNLLISALKLPSSD